MLRDDVLIENIKYGCIIMQNNRAMKLVNFTHAQTAETRYSFCPTMNAGYEAKSTHEPRPSLQCHPRNFITGTGGAWCQSSSHKHCNTHSIRCRVHINPLEIQCASHLIHLRGGLEVD